MPLLTPVLLKIPPMSLKQFMLRSEVLKLYRGFMRLGRIIETPSETLITDESSGTKVSKRKTLHPLQLEWIEWVRSEFRLRQDTADEEAVKMMLAHGKRQLQEMERTILLATNRNSNVSVTATQNSSSSGCKSSK